MKVFTHLGKVSIQRLWMEIQSLGMYIQSLCTDITSLCTTFVPRSIIKYIQGCKQPHPID